MSELSIAVCIATTGRPAILTEALRDVAGQTRRPDRIFVCPAKATDVDRNALASLPCGIEIVAEMVAGRSGLPAQRNALLRAVGEIDLVLFIDDDFLLAASYLAEMERLFRAEPTCVVASGHVLADGARNAGYSVAEGRAIIAAHRPKPTPTVGPIFNAYGCNMAIRWSTIRGTGCAFDENLPLYAWAEDVDFSRQAAAFGRVLKSDAPVGVHLAEKKGRVSGVRFGYSQIANQAYLIRKGTISLSDGLRKAAENMAANLIGAVTNTQAYVDRRGRLRGNLYGLRDLMTGRSSPGRILEL